MMPHTVPNSPMYGEMLAVVARNLTCFSSRCISTPDARSKARSSASKLLRVGREGPLAASPAGLPAAGSPTSWAVNSAYPAWKMPTSGLSASVRQTA